jgi:cobalamin biosynthesis protein CobD/CbiB
MSPDEQQARQSRAMSLVEALTNVVVGFVLAMLTQVVAFPLFWIEVSPSDNFVIAVIFTVVSLVRSFALRRLFEAIRTRQSR